jgi:hypothetical protein
MTYGTLLSAFMVNLQRINLNLIGTLAELSSLVSGILLEDQKMKIEYLVLPQLEPIFLIKKNVQ